ncbi:oligosaccharide flippase family protein [Cytophagaceae bacterium ABcell3]|nr:oligosaccharide flippase family protein [Cytophagaceae bacterium ABcell3]
MVRDLLNKVFQNNNFLSLLGNASAALLGFISFGVLARSLDKGDFGNWVLFITIATLFELLRTGFVQTPLIKFSSGTEESKKNVVHGTSWLFGTIVTFLLGAVTLLVWALFGSFIDNQGVIFFLQWFWLLNIVTLPYNLATWVLQVEMRFNRILYIRLMVLSVFLVLLGVNAYYEYGLYFVLYSYLTAHGLTSVICLALGWTNISSVRFFSKSLLKELFHFGKFSMGTMLGANLLRSSDTLLIGAFLGPSAVAIYSIPLRLMEVMEIPLRSFMATALPTLSAHINNNDRKGFRKYFEKSAGMLTVSFIPLGLACVLFAEPMVWLLGGEQYLESATILRVFGLFAFIMPLDKYSGVSLDVLNKPVLNFWKVVVMLSVNIIGDVLAIMFLGKLWAVAAVSFLTFFSGLVFGVIFLKKLQEFSIRDAVVTGFNECKSLPAKLISKFKTVPDGS